MKNDPYLVPKVLLVVAGMCLSVALGSVLGKREARVEAVKAGVAEFRATPEGDVTFHWKEPKK